MSRSAALFTPVLIAGSLICLAAFGVRASFGVFQIPIGTEFGWPRAEFSLAIAIQNLAWGIGQPFFGALAEKLGDRRAITLGAVLYAAGLLLSSVAVTPLQHQLLGILLGFGIAGTGFGAILAVVGRAASDENRAMSLAIASAVGSGGQVIGPPLAAYLMTFLGWQQVFVVFAVVMLACLAFLPMLKAPAKGRAELQESMGEILGRAFRDPNYALIFMGFFSCGYYVGFLTAHFPAFVTEACGAIDPSGLLASIGVTSTSALGALALSVIGVANIAGTLYAGVLSKRYPKKYILSGIYALRALIGAVFILMPMTPTLVLFASAVMGALWLATVPLTSGLVAHLYGVRYMGTLYGVIFLSHQIGGFLGVWLGGRLYDATGDYTVVWWIGVAIGAFSALVHLPIREDRQVPAAA